MSELFCGDCLDVMSGFEDDSIDTAITDPPYGLEFMGKDWDHGVPGKRFWQEVLRVCKPGAMLLAFGGTRTHHRLMCAIEDAGWEIRDCLMWLYGSGFPKSHDISKGIDKAANMERKVIGRYQLPNGQEWNLAQASRSDVKHAPGTFTASGTRSLDITAPSTSAAQLWHGWGTALKPAWEPIIVAMKPRDGTFAHNAQTWGVAGLWIDGGRIPTNEERAGWYDSPGVKSCGGIMNATNEMREPSEPNPQGRWPANLILDDEAGRLLDEQSGITPTGGPVKAGTRYNHSGCNTMGDASGSVKRDYIKDVGGASRFFYCAKVSSSERHAGCEHLFWRKENKHFVQITEGEWESLPSKKRARGNIHPTVKPLALMRYLVKLTRTPTGGIVLDPFMGSGSTGIACMLEGRDFWGIDEDKDSFKIAERRIEHAQNQERQLELGVSYA